VSRAAGYGRAGEGQSNESRENGRTRRARDGRDNEGQVRVQELGLLWSPQAARLQELRAVDEQGPDPREHGHAGRGEVGPRGAWGAVCYEKGSSEEEASLADRRAGDDAEAGLFSRVCSSPEV
jgi:hypothetical protein